MQVALEQSFYPKKQTKAKAYCINATITFILHNYISSPLLLYMNAALQQAKLKLK